MARAEELFADKEGGYFDTRESEHLLMRIKSGIDSAVPNANAVMLHNMIDLFEITKDKTWRGKAQRLADYFLSVSKPLFTESAGMAQAALRLVEGKIAVKPAIFASDGGDGKSAPKGAVTASATLFPADAKPGDECELIVTLDIKDGWHVNANPAGAPFLIPTQVEVHGRR